MATKRLCVFCGSASGNRPAYAAAARAAGAALAGHGVEIVYGGGRIGLMGTLADAALEAGGRVIGIIPAALERREVAHRGLTELHVVSSMHERKALMAKLADGFVALPGGFGTLEELFEVLTWRQLEIYDKPSFVLNVEGYYDKLIALLDQAVDEGFLSRPNRALLSVGASIEALLAFAGVATAPGPRPIA
jgi:hypothetical protein